MIVFEKKNEQCGESMLFVKWRKKRLKSIVRWQDYIEIDTTTVILFSLLICLEGIF